MFKAFKLLGFILLESLAFIVMLFVDVEKWLDIENKNT